MAFRWKTPELNPTFVDPQAAMANRAAMQMQGYVPNSAGYPTDGRLAQDAASAMVGYNPTNIFPAPAADQPRYAGMASRVPEGMDIYGQGADYEKRTQIQERISELEAELTSVTNQIAEIDKATPGLAKNPKEWEIAAERAEIGDMSAYDNLVSRGSSDATTASGIENELYNAEKLTWGLHSKSNEDIAIARANIEASLRRAEEWASRTGKELPSSYYRLRKELDSVPDVSDDYMNARNYGNDLALKIYRGTATDEDIEKGVAWAEKNPNSDAAKEILEAAKSGKYSTVEAKARRKSREKAAKDKIIELQKLPVSEQEKKFDALDQKLKDDILKQAQWDTTGNRGLVWKR